MSGTGQGPMAGHLQVGKEVALSPDSPRMSTAGKISDLNDRLVVVEGHVQEMSKAVNRLIEGVNVLRSELGIEVINPESYTK